MKRFFAARLACALVLVASASACSPITQQSSIPGQARHASFVSRDTPPDPSPTGPPPTCPASSSNCNPVPVVPTSGGSACAMDPSACPNLSPDLLALRPWALGEPCYDSFAAIGDNIPMNTTDTGHEVANIDKIALINGNQVGPFGYVYKDKNGEMYLQESPSYTGSFWTNMAGQIPVVGQLVKAVADNGSKNTTVPITSDDLQKIKANVSTQQPGMKGSVTGCFKDVPPGTQTV